MANILVLGGAHIDRRGRIHGDTTAGASNPGSWMSEPGGGAFNAARALARLGHHVRLISPRGGDEAGESVAQAAEAAGIDDCPFTFLDRTTPSYTAILERDGNLVIAIADMDLYRLFTPRRLKIRAVREAIDAADLILTDANLPAETLAAIATTAENRSLPIGAIAISPAKVVRFAPILSKLDFLFMNIAEARTLSKDPVSGADRQAGLLKAMGLKGAMITDGARMMAGFSGDCQLTLTPPTVVALADVTGAGDAAAAGFLDAVAQKAPLADALRQAAACAAITVQTHNAASMSLSRDMLNRQIGLVPDPKILP